MDIAVINLFNLVIFGNADFGVVSNFHVDQLMFTGQVVMLKQWSWCNVHVISDGL